MWWKACSWHWKWFSQVKADCWLMYYIKPMCITESVNSYGIQFLFLLHMKQIYWYCPRPKASFMEGWIYGIRFSFSCLSYLLMWVRQNASWWSYCFIIMDCSWIEFWSMSVIWCEEWKCYRFLEGSWWICDKGMYGLQKRQFLILIGVSSAFCVCSWLHPRTICLFLAPLTRHCGFGTWEGKANFFSGDFNFYEFLYMHVSMISALRHSGCFRNEFVLHCKHMQLIRFLMRIVRD